MIGIASPPFAWGVDIIFGAVFLLWLFAWNLTALNSARTRLQIAATSILGALLLVLPTSELFHRRMPEVRGPQSDRVLVIGDSISSGLGNRVLPWPAIMRQMTGVEVRNISKPGATAADGLAMAAQVTPEDKLVLIELGGNDLIAGEPSDTISRALEGILAKLAAHNRVVVTFELPLIPEQVAYGQVQRRLATRYGVWLIPKRYFSNVIGGKDSTSDGSHLTEVGTRCMASVVMQAFLPVLKTPSTDRAKHL